MFYLCKISSRPIKGTKDKIFSKENNNHLNPRNETKRQRASPNTNYVWRWKTRSFGGKQIPCRWEKLGSSKNDLCPLGGISFVWLNVMAAKTSFWLNTLAWARVHPQCITVFDIWIGPGLNDGIVINGAMMMMRPFPDFADIQSSEYIEQIQEVRSV